MRFLFKNKFLTDHKSNVSEIYRPWSAYEYGLGSIDFKLDLKNFLKKNYNINF